MKIIEFFVGLQTQSLPRETLSKTFESQTNALSIATSTTVTTAAATATATKKQFSTKSLSKKYNDFDYDGTKNSDDSVMASSVAKSKFESSHTERTHSEEGFFRRFINRSGRKHKKDRDANVDKDVVDNNNKKAIKAANVEPAIKKSEELSIINVLSKARENETPLISKPLLDTYLLNDELSGSSLSATPKSDKPKSGPNARQRILPKNVSPSRSDDILTMENTQNNNQKLFDSIADSTKVTSIYSSHPEPTKSIGIADSHLHYRSEEILNSSNKNNNSNYNESTSPYSISLPKCILPSEGKFVQNASRNSHGGWNQQQKFSKAANANQQSPNRIKLATKGKMVEKSKSFRLYTKHSSSASPHNESKPTLSGNMPSLPDLNGADDLVCTQTTHASRYSANRDSLNSLRFMNSNRLNANSNQKWPTRSSSSSRIFDSNSNSEFGSNEFNFEPNHEILLPMSTTDDIGYYDGEKKASSHAADGGSDQDMLPAIAKNPAYASHHLTQNQNINEIEDNIDKIMKSSVFTVLKKSSTADSYQIKTNPANVSLTTISKNKPDDVPNKLLNIATCESPPLLRSSVTTSKLDIPPAKKVTSNVPEFMQIQLNRVDGRTKSYIEYSSSAPSATSSTTTIQTNDDDKERRFSNESIEISDKKKVAINSFSSDQNLDNSRLMRATFNNQLSRGGSNTDINKSVNAGTNRNASDEYFNSSSEDANDNLDANVVVQRRKSVSDKKLKFEKKIEEIQNEVKRSSIIGIEKLQAIAARHALPTDDENFMMPVILRSKKLPSSKSSQDSDDPTPELIKVFARRSLKIKDTDDYLVPDDERSALNQKSFDNSNNNAVGETINNLNRLNNNKMSSNKPSTVDSDKENHLSSGSGPKMSDEKLLSNVALHRKSVDFDNKSAMFGKKDNEKPDADNASLISHTSNIFSGSQNRIPNNAYNNYRNSAIFFENLNGSNNIYRSSINSAKGNKNNINNNPPANNGVVLIIDNDKTLNEPSSKTNISLNSTNTNAKKCNVSSGTAIDDKINKNYKANVNNDTDNINIDADIEYKGILERKAEWEKRASQHLSK